MARLKILSLMAWLQAPLLVSAAALHHPVPFTSIPITQNGMNFSSLENKTFLHEPEFPHPLPDPFTYPVRYTDYSITFTLTAIQRRLDPTEIHTCIVQAIRMASEMNPNAVLPTGHIETHASRLPSDMVFSATNIRPGEEGITWREWADVLSGFVRFTQAYEGVGFRFEVDGETKGKVLKGFCLHFIRGSSFAVTA